MNRDWKEFIGFLRVLVVLAMMPLMGACMGLLCTFLPIYLR